MKLSDLAAAACVEVLRDGEFASLGMTFFDLPRMLVALYDPRYLNECRRNAQITSAITTPSLAASLPKEWGVAVCEDPRQAFLEAHLYLAAETDFYGADFGSEIDAAAQIHPAASIAGKNVRIGANVQIGPGAAVLPGVTIGDGSRIGPGAIVGAEGFSPAPDGSGLPVIPHTGACRVGSGVEIQSNSVVCRGFYSGATAIGDGSVLSSLVNVSHNVRIGCGARIGAGACILGSSRLGDGVRVGPNATVSNRVRIGDGAQVTLGAVVVRDVAAGQTVSGNFAMEHGRFLSWFRRARSKSRED